MAVHGLPRLATRIWRSPNSSVIKTSVCTLGTARLLPEMVRYAPTTRPTLSKISPALNTTDTHFLSFSFSFSFQTLTRPIKMNWVLHLILQENKVIPCLQYTMVSRRWGAPLCATCQEKAPHCPCQVIETNSLPTMHGAAQGVGESHQKWTGSGSVASQVRRRLWPML
jgi:hypothetical protein